MICFLIIYLTHHCKCIKGINIRPDSAARLCTKNARFQLLFLLSLAAKSLMSDYLNISDFLLPVNLHRYLRMKIIRMGNWGNYHLPCQGVLCWRRIS